MSTNMMQERTMFVFEFKREFSTMPMKEAINRVSLGYNLK